jgi:hypothetical protein
MDWLAHGLPLTLLCDLTSTQPPPSHAIYLDESPPAPITADHARIVVGEAV